MDMNIDGFMDIEEYNNLKQHADKIIQFIEKIDQNSTKRAIWELFQNAVDLSENCEIVIEQKPDKFIFKHNGAPFTKYTLDCLIVQVSSKVEHNKDDIGQYGTGFLTTHSFSKIVYVSGSIDLENGEEYVDFEDFLIDRTFDDSDSKILMNKLKSQRNKAKILENIKKSKEPKNSTIFTYLTNLEIEKENVNKAMDSLSSLLPYVMAINEKIKKVSVTNIKGNTTVYKKDICENKNEIKISPIIISINDMNVKFINIYSLNTNNTIIILPISDDNNVIKLKENIPRIFVSFPLIGTENFGFNYIVHSKKFYTNETRDNILLKSSNPDTEYKEDNNRKLLQEVYENILHYLNKINKNLNNKQYLAIINFKSQIPENILLTEYFNSIKKSWVNSFKNIPLVDCKEKLLKPINSFFFKEELLEDPNYDHAIYNIVNYFYADIPDKKIVKDWTEIVTQWKIYNGKEYENEMNYVKLENILEKIQYEGNIEKFIYKKIKEDLKKFYQYMVQKNKIIEFDNYSLLPNIYNILKKRDELYTYYDIEEILKEIAVNIIPDKLKSFIHKEFILDIKINEYNKEKYSNDINQELSRLLGKLKKDEQMPDAIYQSLITYCTIFNTQKENRRRKLIRLICKYHKRNTDYIEINGMTSDVINWETPIKYLLKDFILQINIPPININIFKELLSIIYGWGLADEFYLNMPLFPDQNGIIHYINDLKVDNGIQDEIKDLYDEIFYDIKGESIKSILLYNKIDFSLFFINDKDKIKTSEIISREIEDKIVEVFSIEEINKHPYKNTILKIINFIKSRNWGKYFPQIDNKKQEIFFAACDNEDTKNFIFDLLTNETKKDFIRNIYNIENLEEIIELGKIEYENKRIGKCNWKHKKEIGNYIENTIRDKIGKHIKAERSGLGETKNKQFGQDIIIYYDNKEIYYIEIKSRWSTDSPIAMSSLQMKTAIKQKENYALVYVDMSDYEGDERYTANFEQIYDRIKVILDIGNRIRPLELVFDLENKEEEVYLINYRGNVSQKLIKQTGKMFNDLIDMLISILNKM